MTFDFLTQLMYLFKSGGRGVFIYRIETMSADPDSFYLAGGTGLALQLGHRRSDDFDFFRRCRKRTFTLDAFNR